jgi:DNA-binding winged helix-turn-helix (wHTH) protein
MLHRFPSFEIDEHTREVRAGSRALPLQPRVFDLLVYLAQNRDRVVSKDELLDKIWTDVTVADGSLQRAVSLARAALAEVGAPDVIRTHARRGYRFCIGETAAATRTSAEQPDESSAMQRADAAYQRRDWLEVIETLQEVDRHEGLSADDLQRWAHAAQYAGRSYDAIAPLERAVAAYHDTGDRARAAWVAIHLAQLRMEWRELVLAKGWYHRAARLLENEPPCREQGHLALLGCRMALLENEVEKALELAIHAREAGERFNDRDLESLGLVYIGEASLFSGRIREGLAALDEAGASVVANSLSAWAGGLVYCSVIYSCMTRADWQRAGQWTEQFTRWGEDKGMVGYPGLCRIHRAEVLTVRGNLQGAEQEVRASREMLARDAPWAEGESWRVTGEILLAKGEFDAARQALTRATELGWETQFDLALLRFAEGDAGGAANLLARTLAENAWSGRSRRGRALAHYCITAATAGRIDEARAALAQLDQEPDLVSTHALQALALQARGELAAAEGRQPEAITLLRNALRAWLEVEAPLAAAHTRCRLATLLAAEGDQESSTLEMAAAVAAFRRAGAHGLLARCEKLHASLKPV